MVELCLLRPLTPAVLVPAVATVETLPLLGGRPVFSAFWDEPLDLECDCLGWLSLEPEAAV